MFFSSGSTQSLPCHTASGENCTSSICPNTVVTYTCTITSGTAAGLTDWTLPSVPDKIRLSQSTIIACPAADQHMWTPPPLPYTASSLPPSDAIYCLSSILTVNIRAAMNGSTVTCSAVECFNFYCCLLGNHQCSGYFVYFIRAHGSLHGHHIYCTVHTYVRCMSYHYSIDFVSCTSNRDCGIISIMQYIYFLIYTVAIN